ncbi:MAG: hypothetical protein H0T46_27360 [Deltaproteobacteria bacterium]|nr:hypothetical protein [Deltaproteobacteria bacterium]
MGLFHRFREDVKRVAAMLEPVLGGELAGPAEDQITWHIDGTRGGRTVQVELNEMHGIFGIACNVEELPIETLRIEEEQSIFSGDTPYIAPKLKMSTPWDAKPLWERLPDTTRHMIVEMMESPSSSMAVRNGRLSMLLGSVGLLRQADAHVVIVRQLDRLLAIAPAIETSWNVDPRFVGAGRSTHVPKPQPQPVAPLAVETRDATTISQRAQPARDAMLERFAAERIETFPAASAMSERDRVIGKVVLLPPQPPSAWVSDFTHKTIAVGEAEHRWYFARADEPGFTRVLRAVERYERATGTKVDDEPYEVIGRITGEPMMVVAAGKAQVGHKLEMLGALVGSRVFIDATQREGADSLFAGERD